MKKIGFISVAVIGITLGFSINVGKKIFDMFIDEPMTNMAKHILDKRSR